MAHLDPNSQFEELKKNLIPTLTGLFPVIGKQHTLQLDKVWVEDDKDMMDFDSQKEAKLAGRTWAVPVYGSISLVDNLTNKVVDSAKKVRLVSLPKITHRFSYIIDGKEYQTITQFRRRPGVYAQVANNGELVSQFNLSRGGGANNFDIRFDPNTRVFSMRYRNSESNIKLYPVLKAMNVDDDTLERAWGKEILTANAQGSATPEYRKLYKAIKKQSMPSEADAIALINDVMSKTSIDPETTNITLGKAFDHVEGDTMVRAANKLLSISRNEATEDDMHSLVFKRTHAIEDFIPERVQKMSGEFKRKILNNLDRKSNVSGIIGLDNINRYVHTFFTVGSLGLAQTTDQINPLEMIAGQTKTTILGAGGIGSEFQITRDEKSINPSHIGFLDPVTTPESSRIGAILSMPIGATKKGQELFTTVYDMKEGKNVLVRPHDIYSNYTVFPDQVTWEGGKPKTIGKTVKMTMEGNVEESSLAKARYVFTNPKALFGIAANLIPFMQNNMGTRATTASRQQEQALPLVYREAPNVQSSAGQGKSFEEILGHYVAQKSTVAGKVTSITDTHVAIKGSDGKITKIQIYNNFPLNEYKSFITSTPIVKVGDSIKEGQVVADTNFTKDGTLAMGTNLRVAYIPYRGYNFEDGIVVSESGAKKLSSEHMHKVDLHMDENTVIGKNRFIAYRRKDLPLHLANKLDSDGVIKKGEIVHAGDVVVAALEKRGGTKEAELLTRISRGKITPFRDASVKWTEGAQGEVVDVIKTAKAINVFIRAIEPLQIGDKIVGRSGNKGIVTSILPDSEMPHTADGRSTDVLMNPAGVPGRVNLGQILETAAAKVVEKTGKRFMSDNFSGQNYTEVVRDLLKKHNITDKELLYDGQSNKLLGNVLVGPQYIFKLKHQVDTKLTARSRDSYDINQIPQRGGPMGGQSLGTLGIYALLAHGAKANLREMQTYKSDANSDYWHAIQSGEPLPPPRPPFTYGKFTAYLKGAGIDIYKDGNSLMLTPLLNKHILDMSSGMLTSPSMVVKGKNLSPIKGGLFDIKMTGGPEGTKWSHMQLSEPVPNPIFESAVKSLLSLTKNQYRDLVAGNVGIDNDNKISAEGGIRGGRAIEVLLKRINVKKEIDSTKKLLDVAPSSQIDKLNRKFRILKALDSHGISPDVYVMHNVPIVPPKFRPLTRRPDGSVNPGDLNGLYKNLAMANESLAAMPKSLPEIEKAPLRAAIYDAMQALNISGTVIGGREHKGIISIISGPSPKEGFFQDKMLKRRQDMSLRSTIIPEPKMGLDEVGIPEEAAWTVYAPFVQRRLRQLGVPSLQAMEEVNKRTPQARAALEYAIQDRPIMIKRDPALHKFSILAFKPVLHKGKAVKIHPLVTGGFNADFDGDTMSAYVPVTQEAVREAQRMYPSNNLFSSTTGLLMNNISHESLLGVYQLSQWGSPKAVSFKTQDEALKAAFLGKLKFSDVVTAGKIQTTPGRIALANTFPETHTYVDKNIKSTILTDKNFIFDKKTLTKVMTDLAKKDKHLFADTVTKLQNAGTEHVYTTGFSIGLDDLVPFTTVRDRILKAADSQVAKVKDKKLTKLDQDQQVVDIYSKAGQMVEGHAKKHFEGEKNNIYEMVRSGARGNWDQFRQMVVAPMLVRNAQGEIIPMPIKRSYSEGLDTADYWTAMHGAREGIVRKVIGTSEPGALSKVIMASTLNLLVSDHDCGTSHGTSMKVDDPQVLGRYLAQPVTINGKNIPKDTLLTSEIVTRLENNKVNRVIARSPMRCELPAGICQKCFGLNEYGQLHTVGTNIGVIAGHALGEPATQLALKAFHEGGVAGSKTTTKTDAFTRLRRILAMPKLMPNSAVLSKQTGTISSVEKDPAGGLNVYVNQEKHYVPAIRSMLPDMKAGAKVTRGEQISDGDMHPVDLLDLTSINNVQEYLADELFGAYKDVGPVKKTNIETVVKAMTNLAYVEDPGDHPDFAKGDYASSSQLISLNRGVLKGKKPIMFKPILKPIEQLPYELSTDWLARLGYRNLKQTLIEGTQQGWKSMIHQNHPIPGLVYGASFGLGTKEKPWLY